MRGVFAPVTEEEHGEGDEEIGDCEPRHVGLQGTMRLALCKTGPHRHSCIYIVDRPRPRLNESFPSIPSRKYCRRRGLPTTQYIGNIPLSSPLITGAAEKYCLHSFPSTATGGSTFFCVLSAAAVGTLNNVQRRRKAISSWRKNWDSARSEAKSGRLQDWQLFLRTS